MKSRLAIPLGAVLAVTICCLLWPTTPDRIDALEAPSEQEQGITARVGVTPSEESASSFPPIVITDFATPGWSPLDIPAAGPPPAHQERETTWLQVDSLSFTFRIPKGEHCAIGAIPGITSLQVYTPPANLTEMALQAVDRAPDWLQADLADNLSRLDDTRQDFYANIILTTEHPYVDEVAFSIAHISYVTLQSGDVFYYDQLLVENAQDVYEHASVLDYVEVVDYGSPDRGGNYYSTTRYWVEVEGVPEQRELDWEIYYWHLVHPRISDERPTYINPETGAGAAPPTGVFWRDYLFNHADEGYSLLRDNLAGCSVLWRNVQHSMDNGAVGIITAWIQEVMDFTSGAERPIQPVRIYHLHVGRCGEHADITAAAGRLALIPTQSPSAHANDHTWNEFWDTRWCSWEPVNGYIDEPDHYDNWWDMAGAFNWRGDGYVWDVTERYTAVCSLTVTVLDTFGIPVDGARVSVETESYDYLIFTWAYTDRNGQCSFQLGDNRDYYARINSDIGAYPGLPFVHALVIEGSIPGEHYYWSHNLKGIMPVTILSDDGMPPEPEDQYLLEVSATVNNEISYGKNRYTNDVFIEPMAAAHIDFFICDQTQYDAYQASGVCEAFEIMEDVGSAFSSFVLPTHDPYYAVISNHDALVDAEVVEMDALLFVKCGADVPSSEPSLAAAHGAWASPNPFSSGTMIQWRQPEEAADPDGVIGDILFHVYDVRGRLIAELQATAGSDGTLSCVWDGSDRTGAQAATGVYFAIPRGGNTGSEEAVRLLLLR